MAVSGGSRGNGTARARWGSRETACLARRRRARRAQVTCWPSVHRESIAALAIAWQRDIERPGQVSHRPRHQAAAWLLAHLRLAHRL